MADNLKEEVKNVFNQFGLFILSTSKDNIPRSRYMTGSMGDDLSVWGATHLSSQKVSIIKNNPNALSSTLTAAEKARALVIEKHGTDNILRLNPSQDKVNKNKGDEPDEISNIRNGNDSTNNS